MALRSSLKLLHKSDRSTENGITFPDPVKNPNAFPATINIPVLLMQQHSSNIFLNPYNLWDMVPAALMSLSHTNDTCSIGTLNQKPNNLEWTHIRCSLHCERWTVKGRDCASALHSFKKITYRTDEWTKQLLRLKSWVISGSPEHWMELHRLWWTVIVSKCSYLFHLFDFYCLLVKILLFFRKFTFLFPFFDNFEWATKVHCNFLCKVTLL